MISSVLDEIEGLGPKRKEVLLKHFGSAQKVAEAELIDLEQVKGVSAALARTIYQFFRQD